jgi:hypothetical protein
MKSRFFLKNHTKRRDYLGSRRRLGRRRMVDNGKPSEYDKSILHACVKMSQ